MKSTEYKATEDTNIKESDQQTSEDINEGIEETGAINFSV